MVGDRSTSPGIGEIEISIDDLGLCRRQDQFHCLYLLDVYRNLALHLARFFLDLRDELFLAHSVVSKFVVFSFKIASCFTTANQMVLVCSFCCSDESHRCFLAQETINLTADHDNRTKTIKQPGNKAIPSANVNVE